MAGFVRMSEAASIGLHAMLMMGAQPESVHSNKRLAMSLRVSDAHLSKVLQRLTREGLVAPIRGPAGGFTLGRQPDDISLLDIYEAIEGPYQEPECLLKEPVCNGDCFLSGAKDLSRQLRDQLAGKNLRDAAKTLECP